MDFIDRIRELAAQVPKLADHIRGNEEATKNALVMPFISALGYNVFDPTEVVPEFTADIGTKRGEKVDYAIQKDDKPIMLFECKSYGTDLGAVHASQLYRYFTATEARFGILTNGVEYRFYSDLEAPNRMDERPFLVIDLSEVNEMLIKELKRFTKSSFDIEDILSTASELKYTREIKKIITSQMTSPDEEFVRFFVGQVYSGRMTQSVKEQFSDIVMRALNSVIRERVDDTLRSASELVGAKQIQEPLASDDARDADEIEDIEEVKPGRKIVTTPDEIEGYFAVKSILRPVIDIKRVAMRDLESYCGILLDDNNRKPICRLRFNRAQKYIGLFDAEKNETRMPIDGVDDIYQFAEQLKEAVEYYEKN